MLSLENKRFISFIVAFATIVIVALALRLPKLAQRPMHTDEAVHAVKFGELLENNSYTYNPYEYHGPTLVYSTLLPAWLQGQKTFADLTELTLRIVPVLFGMALILMLLVTLDLFRKRTILFAALLTTLSPAFVFFSRYYIMEILLVFFTFSAMLCLYKYIQTQKIFWVIGSGISLGLMHATKETCILAWFSMGAALILTLLTSKKNIHDFFSNLNWKHILLALASGMLVSLLLFSSFFQNPRGIVDSILTYTTNIQRGAGGLNNHTYPWNQYIKWLMMSEFEGRPLLSEAFIIVLSIPGFFGIFSKSNSSGRSKPFLPFLAFYTLILTLVYSLMPYKTPWLALGFYHGYIIIAAVGATTLFTSARSKFVKIILGILLVSGTLHLGRQAYQLNYKYDTDTSNPYVYAHTDADFYKLVDGIKDMTSTWPEGKNTSIEVVCPDSDYWPLPWYLRDFTNVGYFNQFDFSRPAGALIVTMPDLEPDLLKKLYEVPPPGQRHMYIPHFEHGVLLRSGVEIDLYVRKDVWDEWYRQSP